MPPRFPNRAITIALACFFFVFGLSNAAWVVRIPDIRNLLHVSTTTLGILFLCSAIGAMLSLLAAPRVIVVLSTRFSILAGFALIFFGGLIAVFALFLGNPVLLGIGNFVTGLGFGTADVGVNVESAELEKRVGRSLLPQLHGAFSVGTLGGALLGTLAITCGLQVTWQTLIVNALFVVVLACFYRVIPHGTGRASNSHHDKDKTTRVSQRSNWRNPRLILLGLAIFGGSVTEGGANDWLALSMVDDYKISASAAAITFAVLVGAMSIVRLSGGWLVDRIGRVVALRIFGAIGVIGVLLIIFGAPHHVIAWIGAAAWGAGVALVFPLTISAAADGPNSSGRVAVVTAFGYAAFLVAPPFLGLLAQQVGLLPMFWVFIGLLGLLLIGAGAAKPLQSATHDDGERP